MLAWIQFDCGVLLNVRVLCFSLLFFSAFISGWIIRSQCVSLSRLLFLLCQAGALPGLSLRFVDFCLVHLETNIREYIEGKTVPGFSLLPFSNFFVPGTVIYTAKWRCVIISYPSKLNSRWAQSTAINTQIVKPVCLFDTCRLWFILENTTNSASQLACIGFSHTEGGNLQRQQCTVSLAYLSKVH